MKQWLQLAWLLAASCSKAYTEELKFSVILINHVWNSQTTFSHYVNFTLKYVCQFFMLYRLTHCCWLITQVSCLFCLNCLTFKPLCRAYYYQLFMFDGSTSRKVINEWKLFCTRMHIQFCHLLAQRVNASLRILIKRVSSIHNV